MRRCLAVLVAISSTVGLRQFEGKGGLRIHSLRCLSSVPNWLGPLLLCFLAGLLPGCDRSKPTRSAETGAPLPATVPVDMRAWFLERGITLPATLPPAPPAAKVSVVERLLGDGYQDGVVNWWDLWGLWAWLTSPHGMIAALDLDLLDIDRDGETGWVDLGLLGDFLYGSRKNPHGIGQPVGGEFSVALAPRLDEVTFQADGTWHRFRLNVTPATATVRIRANWSEISDGSFEIAVGNDRPRSNFCPAEDDDTKSNLSHGDIVWLAGCQAGYTSLLVEDMKNTDNWDIFGRIIEPAATASQTRPGFQIELVFLDDLNAAERTVVRLAADRWEKVIIGDVPDNDVPFDSADDPSWWSGWQDYYPFLGHVVVDEVVDDLRIYVGYETRDDFAGAGGSFWGRPNGLPILGVIQLHPDNIMGTHTALHEIGHVLGFSSYEWEQRDLLAGSGNSRRFTGWRAIAAFNAEGGRSYTGLKVPIEAEGTHWRESVFGDELMTGPWFSSDRGPLSETTLQSFADMGYQVDPTQADYYRVPASAKRTAAPSRARKCGVTGLMPYRIAH